MTKDTSILTDAELDAVVGGSFMSAVKAGVLGGANEAVQYNAATSGPLPTFGGVHTGTGSGGNPPCNYNHNGVHYQPM